MVLFLLPTKLAFYAVAFLLAAQRFKRFGPHWKAPAALVVALSVIARIALGGLSATIAVNIAKHEPLLFGVIIFTLGFAFWLGVARVAFRRAPWSGLAAFALLTELVTGTYDAFVWHFINSINFC